MANFEKTFGIIILNINTVIKCFHLIGFTVLFTYNLADV